MAVRVSALAVQALHVRSDLLRDRHTVWQSRFRSLARSKAALASRSLNADLVPSKRRRHARIMRITAVPTMSSTRLAAAHIITCDAPNPTCSGPTRRHAPPSPLVASPLHFSALALSVSTLVVPA
jgi:hypothetical protein